MAEEPISLDNPVQRWKTVKALLILTPFLFAGCYLLASWQGAAPRHAGLIAAIAAVGCLGTAGAIHLLGSQAKWALVAVQAILIALKMVRR